MDSSIFFFSFSICPALIRAAKKRFFKPTSFSSSAFFFSINESLTPVICFSNCSEVIPAISASWVKTPSKSFAPMIAGAKAFFTFAIIISQRSPNCSDAIIVSSFITPPNASSSRPIPFIASGPC